MSPRVFLNHVAWAHHWSGYVLGFDLDSPMFMAESAIRVLDSSPRIESWPTVLLTCRHTGKQRVLWSRDGTSRFGTLSD